MPAKRTASEASDKGTQSSATAMGAAHLSPAVFPWPTMTNAPSMLWRSMEISQQLQLQWMERAAQRYEEMLRHWRQPATATDPMDMALAAMRWSLQEWTQVPQDLMAAALELRGDVRADQGVTGPEDQASPNDPTAPLEA